MNKSIFKAYDIRGAYPDDLDADTAYRIGNALVRFTDAKTLTVGRDARPSGPELHQAVIDGITDAGCDVIDIEMITTPMLYFSSHHLDVDGAVGVTASHNPLPDNGIKMCGKNATPIGGDMIQEIATLAEQDPVVVGSKGSVSTYDIKEEYRANLLLPHITDALKSTSFHIAFDCANTMGVMELPFYKEHLSHNTYTELYCDLDHPYTAHEANPLNTDTLKELQELIKNDSTIDIGVAYDGDADRVGFIDEKGEIVPMDFVTALIARVFLKDNPGATILYDLRSSRAVKEAIEEAGGVAHECRVGHSFIKAQMCEQDALFAGELSGHYYFQQNHNGEISTLAVLTLLNWMAETGQPLSEIVADLRRYAHSGEINSHVADKDAVIAAIKEKYSDGAMTELDGLKVDYSDWWFNVRPSNTEPVLRLNLEAKTEEDMIAKRDELLAMITA